MIAQFATPQSDEAIHNAFKENGYQSYYIKEADYVERNTLINKIEKNTRSGQM